MRVGFERIVVVEVVVVKQEVLDREKVWDLEMAMDRLDSVMAIQERFSRVVFFVPLSSQLLLQYSKSQQETTASTHPQKQIYPAEPDA